MDPQVAAWEARPADPDGTVEKVAQAIGDADYEDVGAGVPWDELSESERGMYRRLAVAALQVVKAPADDPHTAVLAPGDPDARMDAYYYGFERTGVGIVDDILSAVAQAGKSYHGTDMWAEEEEWTKPSHEARIQAAADRAAATLRAALSGGAR